MGEEGKARDLELVNIDRFSGFAGEYNTYRPSPPTALRAILLSILAVDRPTFVVDIGSGTGLSTRYWADHADRVVGIEPNRDMRSQAVSHTSAVNVEYRDGRSHQTGLPNACADMVTCSQALHWLEPVGTFREAARILRPGGVFAAYDYDWPPTTGSWIADAAFEECLTRTGELEEKASLPSKPQKWAKQGHLARMAESGVFRYTREIVLHHLEEGNDERYIGLFMSQGQVMAMLKGGFSEAQLGLDKFRLICREQLGSRQLPWFWSSRVRIGIL
ncbi:MAG TPA: class I SAM-dependent methyltransferase [Spirochaetia bacterium]|nr:class I SAM-dependent methyltransferase [Spirochaetia bacterium]